MITKKNYITANFIDSDRKNIEILLKDGDITRPHIIEAETKLYPALVDAVFNNVENEDDMFALKLALFEVKEIRDSKNTAAKTKLRKSTTKFDILRCAFDIIEVKPKAKKAQVKK